jgi:hypothetical protein
VARTRFKRQLNDIGAGLGCLVHWHVVLASAVCISTSISGGYQLPAQHGSKQPRVENRPHPAKSHYQRYRFL